MNYKPIIIVAGEPFSIFIEIFLKALKKNRFKHPIVLIVSKNSLLLKNKLLLSSIKNLKIKIIGFQNSLVDMSLSWIVGYIIYLK